jgi:hypothetical protein
VRKAAKTIALIAVTAPLVAAVGVVLFLYLKRD